MLGPDYDYYKKIRSPGELGVSSAGNMGAMASDVAGIINYVQLLVEGGGRASTTPGPLGPRYFLKTAAKCKDVKTGKSVPRYIYVDNVPSGNIPLISSGLGVSFKEFEGLLPGILEDVGELNPIQMFSAFMQGSEPSCREVSYPVTSDSASPTSAHISLAEIKKIDAAKGKKEAFISANVALRGEKRKKKRVKVPPLANMYIASFGLLMVYLMYRIVHRKN